MHKTMQVTIATPPPTTRTACMVAMILAAGISVALTGCQGFKSQAPPADPVKLTVLFKTDIPGAAGKEETVFLVEIAPGASTPKHYHPGQEFAYVLEGSGFLYEEGKPPLTLKPGVSVSNYSSPEKAAYAHWATNTSKTEMQRWLVVLVTEKGYPFLIPVK